MQSQGSGRDLFQRDSQQWSQSDHVFGGMSQEWNFSAPSTQEFGQFVPTTPRRSGSQMLLNFGNMKKVPMNPWARNNSSQNLNPTPNFPTPSPTPTPSTPEIRDNQLARKIWLGLTAVFNVVSELPDKLKDVLRTTCGDSTEQTEKLTSVLSLALEEKISPFQKLIEDIQLSLAAGAENERLWMKLEEIIDKVETSRGEISDLRESQKKLVSQNVANLRKQLTTQIQNQQKIQWKQRRIEQNRSKKSIEMVSSKISELTHALHDHESNRMAMSKELSQIHEQVKELESKLSNFSNNSYTREKIQETPAKTPSKNLRMSTQNRFFADKAKSFDRLMSPVARVEPQSHLRSQVATSQVDTTLKPNCLNRNIGQGIWSAKRESSNALQASCGRGPLKRIRDCEETALQSQLITLSKGNQSSDSSFEEDAPVVSYRQKTIRISSFDRIGSKQIPMALRKPNYPWN